MAIIAKKTLDCFLSELADKQSTPGGGAAAAITASQGVALLCMVLNLTVGRRRFREHDECLRPILSLCEALLPETLCCADRDAVAFKAVIHCYDLPKNTEEEKAVRSLQLEKALYKAADVPLELLHICQRLLKEANTISKFGNRTVLSDVMVATHLLRAAAYGCETNIKINLKSVSHSQRRDDFLESMQDSLKKVEVSTMRILEHCQSRLELPT